MIFIIIYLILNDPDLIVKSKTTKEKGKPQKAYLILSGIIFLDSFIIMCLNFRCKWSKVSPEAFVFAALLRNSGYLNVVTVKRQNSYTSRREVIRNEQKRIESGLNSFV